MGKKTKIDNNRSPGGATYGNEQVVVFTVTMDSPEGAAWARKMLTTVGEFTKDDGGRFRAVSEPIAFIPNDLAEEWIIEALAVSYADRDQWLQDDGDPWLDQQRKVLWKSVQAALRARP